MSDEAKSVFDNDVDNKADSMDIDPAVETQFDTADIVFALTGIKREIQYLSLTVAFGVGVLMYMAAKR